MLRKDQQERELTTHRNRIVEGHPSGSVLLHVPCPLSNKLITFRSWKFFDHWSIITWRHICSAFRQHLIRCLHVQLIYTIWRNSREENTRLWDFLNSQALQTIQTPLQSSEKRKGYWSALWGQHLLTALEIMGTWKNWQAMPPSLSWCTSRRSDHGRCFMA